MELYKSPVIFYDVDDAHQYFLPNGVELKGITGVISRHLFPNKYSGIPKSVLANAAFRGDLIHKECEQLDKIGIMGDTVEVAQYAKLKETERITAIENEYIVSDEQNFATKTDLVAQIGDCPADMVDLCDYKTTYSVDKDYLSWQLSINAAFFEKFNEVKVNKLYGIWLRGTTAKLIEVPRKPVERVLELLRCEVEGVLFSDEEQVLPMEISSKLAILAEVESLIMDIEKEAEESKQTREKLVAELYSLMEANAVDKWETNNIIVTKVAPSSSVRVDSAKLKKEYPEIYSSCSKTTNKKGYLKIKIKGESE